MIQNHNRNNINLMRSKLNASKKFRNINNLDNDKIKYNKGLIVLKERLDKLVKCQKGYEFNELDSKNPLFYDVDGLDPNHSKFLKSLYLSSEKNIFHLGKLSNFFTEYQNFTVYSTYTS